MVIIQASLSHLGKMDVTSSYHSSDFMPKFTHASFLVLVKSMALWPPGECAWQTS